MKSDDGKLDAAYRSAVYRVGDGGGRVSFAFDEPGADGAASESGVSLPFKPPWAIITACNPGSELRDASTNERAMQRLRSELVSAGAVFTPAENLPRDGGADADHRWREASFLVEATTLEDVFTLARRFGQRAVVFGDGARTGLAYPADERFEVLSVRRLE